MFRRDPDQTDVPDGFTAYLVTARLQLDAATHVEAVGVKYGLPHLTFASSGPQGGGMTPEPRTSRVLVGNNARIDSAVFTIPAPEP